MPTTNKTGLNKLSSAKKFNLGLQENDNNKVKEIVKKAGRPTKTADCPSHLLGTADKQTSQKHKNQKQRSQKQKKEKQNQKRQKKEKQNQKKEKQNQKKEE